MKIPTEVYKKVRALRGQYGDSEYDRDELIPATMNFIASALDEGADDLLKDAANGVLDRIEKADDERNVRQGCLFSHDAHVALGERRRIKRGAMNLAQINRRKRVIDHNKMAQDNAWRSETEWLNAGADALDGMPPETRIADVLVEAAE